MAKTEGKILDKKNFDLSRSEIVEDGGETTEDLFTKYQTSADGLSTLEINRRLEKYGFNEPISIGRKSVLWQFLEKLSNPLSISLIIVAILSFFFGDHISALIIISMALLSVVLSFVQEYKAGRNVDRLRQTVKITASVIRGGKKIDVGVKDLVPGDILDLKSGTMVPADARIISSEHLFINESSLTGESFPVEKNHSVSNLKYASISDLKNIAFMGTNVVSGKAKAVVVATGDLTQFGRLAGEVASAEGETSFDKGIKKFVWLMIRFILVLSLFIFVVVAALRGNPIQALLFALAVAIGLAPEMLPMIVTVNMSKGAIKMAKKGVIVKRLDSIQNFGAMDVLCTDKTGTLTLDNIELVDYCDSLGKKNEEVLHYAFLNSHFQTGLSNILDDAILKHKKFSIPEKLAKIAEVPFDYSRRIVSVVVEKVYYRELIAKGAPEEILKRSKFYLDGEKESKVTREITEKICKKYDQFSRDGYRVLAIAYRQVDRNQEKFSTEDEKDLIFAGFVAFLDPAKPSVTETIQILNKAGITLKILSGDNELVTEKICSEVKLEIVGITTGEEVEKLNQAELQALAEKTTIFARMDPMQKERVIAALQANGHTVGFLGDGINDAPALKGADVGISVNNAVDIAKETATIILLEKNLNVLANCVFEGRKTFGNVVKYIKMGASSNFGNMLSMTGACIFLPFLPMLPIQILLNNFLYDFSQTMIPTDNVDPEYLTKPRPWDIKFIKNFMFVFGPISSLFDFIAFGVLIFIFHANAELFHTGWFIESLCTQTLIIYIIRTGKIPFLQSRASTLLTISTLLVVAVGCILPFTAVGAYFGFVAPRASYFGVILLIVFAYLILTQFVKNWFIKKFGYE